MIFGIFLQNIQTVSKKKLKTIQIKPTLRYKEFRILSCCETYIHKNRVVILRIISVGAPIFSSFDICLVPAEVASVASATFASP